MVPPVCGGTISESRHRRITARFVRRVGLQFGGTRAVGTVGDQFQAGRQMVGDHDFREGFRADIVKTNDKMNDIPGVVRPTVTRA